MRRSATWALLGVLLAAQAPAVELERVGELRLESGGGNFEWLDAHRYVRLKNEFERAEKAGIVAVTFVVADIREQKLLRLRFPIAAFAKTHPSLFTGPPMFDLVHFDGTHALLKFDHREPTVVSQFYSVWNVQTQAVSEPKQLGQIVFGEKEGKRAISRLTFVVGPDPAASRLYFADVTYDPRPSLQPLPLGWRLFRVGFPSLEVDWELDLPFLQRTRQLPVEAYRVFSADGKKLALAEYYDRAAQREFKAEPPPQVYVVDLETKKVSTYPIPRTPYGLSFSRDGKQLAVGSHEEERIIRIDLESGRIDRTVKAQPHIQGFATTASGESLIVMSDHIGAPRSFEVRRWSDLGLQHSISIPSLFPGIAGIHPSGARATPDGRFLVMPRYAADGYPDSKDSALVTFAIKDQTPSVARADPARLVSAHLERRGVSLYSYGLKHVGNSEGRFAPMVANGRGEALAIGTRSDLPEGAPYENGHSHPLVIQVDSDGKVLWERSLRAGKVFSDYEGAGAVAAPDGSFIVYLLGYAPPSNTFAAARVLKLDRKGKTVWEWTGPIGKEPRFPEEAQLLPSGRILLRGHIGTTRIPWVGELDAKTGKLLRDDVAVAAAAER